MYVQLDFLYQFKMSIQVMNVGHRFRKKNLVNISNTTTAKPFDPKQVNICNMIEISLSLGVTVV